MTVFEKRNLRMEGTVPMQLTPVFTWVTQPLDYVDGSDVHGKGEESVMVFDVPMLKFCMSISRGSYFQTWPVCGWKVTSEF